MSSHAHLKPDGKPITELTASIVTIGDFPTKEEAHEHYSTQARKRLGKEPVSEYRCPRPLSYTPPRLVGYVFPGHR